MATNAKPAGGAGREIAQLARRLRALLALIDGAPTGERDQRALAWMFVEELLSLLAKAWRLAR